jgi:phage terminase small subunit
VKRGVKPLPPALKQERGTLTPCRDKGRTEVEAMSAAGQLAVPHGLPQQPDWLTDAGREVWLDDVGRAASHRLATESDSTQFGNYCNLQGAIIMAWKVGAVPPAAHLMESRRMAEQFGLFGRKSRVIAGQTGNEQASNPFLNNGKRR